MVDVKFDCWRMPRLRSSSTEYKTVRGEHNWKAWIARRSASKFEARAQGDTNAAVPYPRND